MILTITLWGYRLILQMRKLSQRFTQSCSVSKSNASNQIWVASKCTLFSSFSFPFILFLSFLCLSLSLTLFPFTPLSPLPSLSLAPFHPLFHSYSDSLTLFHSWSLSDHAISVNDQIGERKGEKLDKDIWQPEQWWKFWALVFPVDSEPKKWKFREWVERARRAESFPYRFTYWGSRPNPRQNPSSKTPPGSETEKHNFLLFRRWSSNLT